jgi:L-lactate dehydrogenase complex protein LldG
MSRSTQELTTNGREEILQRIRRALRVKAPRPGHHGGRDGTPIDSPVVENVVANTLPVSGAPGQDSGGGPNVSQLTGAPPASAPPFASTLPIIGQPARQWLPLVGESWEEQVRLFAANARDLRADFTVCAGREELRERLRQLARDENWRRIGAHHGEITDFAAQALGLPVTWTDAGYSKTELETCDAGLTLCEALIAQTGTVLVTGRSSGGRALSILPPHHVVLATRDQLVPDLPAAFSLLRNKYGEDVPSMMSFITGPSRTGDIERILVLGAHGPKKLSIFVSNSPLNWATHDQEPSTG